jgi:hypothetical protein
MIDATLQELWSVKNKLAEEHVAVLRQHLAA